MILDVCTKEVSAILGVVHTVVDIVKLAIPVILVVLATFDSGLVVDEYDPPTHNGSKVNTDLILPAGGFFGRPGPH